MSMLYHSSFVIGLGLSSLVRRVSLTCMLRTTICKPTRPKPAKSFIFRSCSSGSQSKIAQISVIPSAAFIDEKVSISVSGLQNVSNITIRAFVDERGKKFESYAHFIPDAKGKIEVCSNPSIRGSYQGVMPMGLFTHMEPSPGQKPGIRLIKKDVTTPLVFHLTVYDGFLSTDDFYSEVVSQNVLTETTVDRWYMPKDVDRIEIRSGNVRGTLFKPKGEGQFPGIIDVFGSAGGIMEYRAALLASYGFATFSLAFFMYEDLPMDRKLVDMEYFEEAVDWMSSNPFVLDSGLGVIGVSSGAQAVLRLSIISGPKISAMVVIGGSSFYTPDGPARLYKGETKPTLKLSLDNVSIVDGVVNVSRYWPYKREDIDWSAMMKLEDATCQFLFIVGEDDKSWACNLYSELACEYLQDHGKNNWKLLSYPGAGHLIEPAYAPLCSACYHLGSGLLILYGGFPDEHSHAQEDSWRKILAFFRKHVGEGDPIRRVPST